VETLDTTRITYTTVAPNGNISYEFALKKEVAQVNGIRQPGLAAFTPDSYTTRPDGTLAAFAPGSGGDTSTHLVQRLYAATTPVFPARAVGVGDRWSHDYPSSASLGLPAAHADFQILGRQPSAGSDAFEVAMKYAEEPNGSGLTSTGVVWVEIATGDCVASKFRLHDVQIPFGSAVGQTLLVDGTVVDHRLSGTPMPVSRKPGR
jgi:hypothetical protein